MKSRKFPKKRSKIQKFDFPNAISFFWPEYDIFANAGTNVKSFNLDKNWYQIWQRNFR